MANESVTVLEDGSGHGKNWILASGEVSEILEEKVRLILPPYKEAVWQTSHLPFVASHAYFLKMCLCPFKCVIFNVKWFCVFFNLIKETCMYFLLVSVFVHVTSLSSFWKRKQIELYLSTTMFSAVFELFSTSFPNPFQF